MAETASQLVGRGAAVEGLERALDELRGGRPCALEVVGEPGIGKSRGCWPSSRRARMPAATSCSAAAHPSSSARFRSGCSSTRWTTTSGRSSRRAATGCPTTPWRSCGMCSRRSRPPAPRRRRPTGATGRTGPCDGSSRSWPIRRRSCSLLDDVHWADAGSIELLDALLRRPPAAPALIAVAVRPRQLPERLSGALERTHRAGGLTRLELGPLSEAEARELLGDGVDGATASALYEESGGNPFYLEQLARTSPRPARERARRRGAPARRPRGAAGRGRGARRGARPAPRPRPPGARGRRRGRRSLRARARRGRRGRARAGRPASPRRAAAPGRRAPLGRPAALPLPPPPHAARRVRGGPGRLAHRRARGHRAGAGRARRPRRGPRPPRRALGQARRHRRRRECCARPRRRPSPGRRRPPRACSTPPCGSSGPAAPERTACSPHRRTRTPRPGGSARPTTACSRAWRPCRGPRRAPACG